MANTFKVTDLVAKEVLRVAHETATFIATSDRQYDETFMYNGAAGKFGQTLRVKSPNMYKRRQGSRVMDVQEQSEVQQNITVATQDGVDMRMNSAELLQFAATNGDTSSPSWENLSKNYIIPATKGLVSAIDADFLAFATKATYQVAGTAGTAITDLTAIGAARAKLNQQLAPKDNSRCVQMDSVTMSRLVTGTAAYFAPNGAVSERFTEGFVKRTGMADFYENERIWTLPNSADVLGEINVTVPSSGATTLVVDGLSVAPVAGMVFTVEGVYDVHPETKVAYPHLKQFVCSTGCTTTLLTFTPAMTYSTTDPRQNCSATSAGPIDNSDVTFVGALSTNYVQPLMYHKEAYQFVTADLPLMNGDCSRMQQDGISVRVWSDSDIRNDELLMRIDILYGMAALRPEWGCRLIGAANA